MQSQLRWTLHNHHGLKALWHSQDVFNIWHPSTAINTAATISTTILLAQPWCNMQGWTNGIKLCCFGSQANGHWEKWHAWSNNTCCSHDTLMPMWHEEGLSPLRSSWWHLCLGLPNCSLEISHLAFAMHMQIVLPMGPPIPFLPASCCSFPHY